jgi:hypothetical protein
MIGPCANTSSFVHGLITRRADLAVFAPFTFLVGFFKTSASISYSFGIVRTS